MSPTGTGDTPSSSVRPDRGDTWGVGSSHRSGVIPRDWVNVYLPTHVSTPCGVVQERPDQEDRTGTRSSLPDAMKREDG